MAKREPAAPKPPEPRRRVILLLSDSARRQLRKYCAIHDITQGEAVTRALALLFRSDDDG